jgi:hypothetical protein
MIARHLQKRNNPWELLLVAVVCFLPGIFLLRTDHPIALINSGGPTRFVSGAVLTVAEAHFFGEVVVIGCIALVCLYIYLRISIARDEKARPSHFLGSRR